MFDDDNKWRDAASNFMAIVMIVVIAMVLVFIILAATLKEAKAQTNLCMSHDDVIEMLDQRYSEGRVAAGIASGGKLIEVYATEDGETWTITITSPGGTTCIMATGEAWNGQIITVIEGPQA